MNLETRIATEKKIATAVVDDLLAAGFGLSLDNGDWAIKNSTDRAAVLGEMFATDGENLWAIKDGKKFGCVCFVYGNDGWDVINDFTVRLEPLRPAHASHANKSIAESSGRA